jgi:hypothetical protein
VTTATVSKLTFAAEIAPIIRQFYRENSHRMTWLYAIQAGHSGPIKIGLAQCPAERMATLQTGNAEKLRGIGAWRVVPEEERWLHEDFAHARIRGEWFRPVPELVEYVTYHGSTFYDWDLAQLKRDRLRVESGLPLEDLPV